MSTITEAILIVLVAALACYDMLALVQGGREATISAVVYEASQRFPAIPLATGFVLGHLFWPQKVAK